MAIFVNHNSHLVFSDEHNCNYSIDNDFIDCLSTFWDKKEKCDAFDELVKETVSFFNTGAYYKKLKEEIISTYDEFTESAYEEVGEEEAEKLLKEHGYEWGD